MKRVALVVTTVLAVAAVLLMAWVVLTPPMHEWLIDEGYGVEYVDGYRDGQLRVPNRMNLRIESERFFIRQGRRSRPSEDGRCSRTLSRRRTSRSKPDRVFRHSRQSRLAPPGLTAGPNSPPAAHSSNSSPLVPGRQPPPLSLATYLSCSYRDNAHIPDQKGRFDSSSTKHARHLKVPRLRSYALRPQGMRVMKCIGDNLQLSCRIDWNFRTREHTLG